MQHFKDANTFNTCNLRATLREHGVWVKKDRGSILPEALYNVLQEKQPTKWTRFEIEDYIKTKGKFKSGMIEHII
jgi:hypothetical protein